MLRSAVSAVLAETCYRAVRGLSFPSEAELHKTFGSYAAGDSNHPKPITLSPALLSPGVVGLVGPDGHHHHGHGVVDRLVQAVDAAVREERPGRGVAQKVVLRQPGHHVQVPGACVAGAAPALSTARQSLFQTGRAVQTTGAHACCLAL